MKSGKKGMGKSPKFKANQKRDAEDDEVKARKSTCKNINIKELLKIERINK